MTWAAIGAAVIGGFTLGLLLALRGHDRRSRAATHAALTAELTARGWRCADGVYYMPVRPIDHDNEDAG